MEPSPATSMYRYCLISSDPPCNLINSRQGPLSLKWNNVRIDSFDCNNFLINMFVTQPSQPDQEWKRNNIYLPIWWLSSAQLSPVLHSIWLVWSVSPAGRLAWVFRADIIFHADRRGAGELVSTNNPGGCSTQSVSWCMEWRDGIETKKGERRETWVPAKSSKLEKILTAIQIDLGSG